MATIAITGANGFLGQRLVQHYANQRQDIIAIDLKFEKDDLPAGVQKLQLNLLSAPPITITEQLRAKNIDTVIHCATNVPLTREQHLYDANPKMTRNIWELSKRWGTGHFVHVSSSSVFGVTGNVYPDSPPHPIDPYGVSKLQSEQVLLQDDSPKAPQISIVRPRTIIGPQRGGIFSILFQWIEEGYHIPIIGNGNNRLQFIHVGDLISAIARIVNIIPENPAMYHIGTDRFEPLKQELQYLCNQTPSSQRVICLPQKPAELALGLLDRLNLSPLTKWHYLSYAHDFVFTDTAQVMTALNWAPRYSNKEMLLEAYESYKASRSKSYSSDYSIHRAPTKQLLLGTLKKLF